MIDWDLFQSQMSMLIQLHEKDFVNDYSAYYGLLGHVIDVSCMNLGNSKKKIAIELLKKYNIKCDFLERRDDENSQKIFKYGYMIYGQVIEVERGKQNRKVFIDSMMMPQVRRLSTKPVTMTLKPIQPSSSHLSVTPTPGFTPSSQDIQQSILEFGKSWTDENDEHQRKMLNDEELAEIFETGDIDELDENISTQIYELTAHQFQMEEYQNYISHFKEIRNNKNSKLHEERECEDENCGWNKEKYRNALFSLSPKQVVHAMFYHTKGN